MAKHVLYIVQLYKQLGIKKATSVEIALSLGMYVTRWQRWAAAGLQGLSSQRLTFAESDQSNHRRTE